MTQHDRDLEDLLRRALHSAADSLEPSSDSLQRIRARLTAPYAVPAAWMIAAYAAVARRVLGGLDSLWAWLSVPPGPAQQCRRVMRPGPPPRWHRGRVRLAVAVVAAAFAVTIGVSTVTPPLRQAIAQTGSFVRSVGSRLSGSTGGGLLVSGRGAMPLRGGVPAATAAAGTQNHLQPSGASCAPPAPGLVTSSANPGATVTPTTCTAPASSPVPASNRRPSLSPAPPDSPTPPASPSPSVSPTVSVSPSPSASPTPPASPSPSVSPGPG